MDVISFLIPSTGWLSALSLHVWNVTVCVCVWCVWCMFIYVCLTVCAVMYYFCSASDVCTDSEQQGWRESLLTVSDGKLWNGNKASCHYSTNSLFHTHTQTATQASTARRQWLQTNKQITSLSPPSLKNWTQIVMRHVRSENRIVLNGYKCCCQ